MRAETFFERAPKDHVFISRRDDDGKTGVQFGDGNTGARLPSGANNVRAKYRKGIGIEGLVKAGQLSMLLSRPLGVKGVTNPLAASGAQDPEQIDDARANAPLRVLTLERVVSLLDYEDFAARLRRHRQSSGELGVGWSQPRRVGDGGRARRSADLTGRARPTRICSRPCAPPAIRSLP